MRLQVVYVSGVIFHLWISLFYTHNVVGSHSFRIRIQWMREMVGCVRMKCGLRSSEAVPMATSNSHFKLMRYALTLCCFIALAAVPSTMALAQDDGAVTEEDAGDVTPNPEVKLRSAAICTKKECSKDRPCCNSCSIKGWYHQGQTVIFSGDAPTCDADGCGQCPQALHAVGQSTQAGFEVERWTWKDKVALETVVLVPVAMCTAQACPQSEPCCNSCGLSGWAISGGETVTFSGHAPKCNINGCGLCEGEHLLKAVGTRTDSGFVVERWRWGNSKKPL